MAGGGRALRRIRRVMLVYSGHDWSTIDACTGLERGFIAAGVDVVRYRLDERIKGAQAWLEFARSRWGQPGEARASAQDVLYQSAKGAIVESLEHDVDAVVVVCGLLFDARAYILFHRAGLPVFLFGTESPYDDDLYRTVAPLCAAVSVNERCSVADVRAACDASGRRVPVLYLPMGFDPTVHAPDRGRSDLIPSFDVVFVGNMYPSRQSLLERVDWTGVNVGLFGVFALMEKVLPWWIAKLPGRLRIALCKRLAGRLPGVSGLWRYVAGGVVANQITAVLHANAKITLNLFRHETLRDNWDTVEESPEGISLSPRIIEQAAAGCFIISEYRPEVAEVFGSLVPTFQRGDSIELERLIRYYLEHEDERRAMAAKLPARVASYSYHTRAAQILDALEAQSVEVTPC